MTVRRLYAILPFDKNLQEIPGGRMAIQTPKSMISTFFLKKEDALSQAEELAATNPKTPVLLLAAVAVIEAKKPETTQKEFKDNGELIPNRKPDSFV